MTLSLCRGPTGLLFLFIGSSYLPLLNASQWSTWVWDYIHTILEIIAFNLGQFMVFWLIHIKWFPHNNLHWSLCHIVKSHPSVPSQCPRSQWSQDVMITSSLHQNDVATSWHNNDIITSFVRWDPMTDSNAYYRSPGEILKTYFRFISYQHSDVTGHSTLLTGMLYE